MHCMDSAKGCNPIGRIFDEFFLIVRSDAHVKKKKNSNPNNI